MKRLALLVLSSLLLTSASYAGNTKCDDCYDFSTKNAAALHHTVSKPNSPESKYWDDYIHSGTKDITVYVRDLSRKDAQAALWFITTGGKHGFAARQATEYERGLLEDAIKQVALSYSQQGIKSGRGLQEWSQVSTANHAGHLHLQMIYKQIDDLKKISEEQKVEIISLKDKTTTLEVRVNLLEIEKNEGLSEIKLLRQELKQAKIDSDTKYDQICADLRAEVQTRAADIERLTTNIEARESTKANSWMDRILTVVQASEARLNSTIEKLEADRDKDRLEREALLKRLDEKDKKMWEVISSLYSGDESDEGNVNANTNSATSGRTRTFFQKFKWSTQATAAARQTSS